MSGSAATEQSQIDAVFQAQRLRLFGTATAAAAAAFSQLNQDRQATISRIVRIVTAGQTHTVRLVDAYMTAKSLQATGRGTCVGLNPASYTTGALRKLAAESVYGRPFGAYGAFMHDGASHSDALKAGQASVTKLAATDLQLAQTHAARDWMQTVADRTPGNEIRIVGYRRVLSGSGPHCKLCTAASTRTYRVSDLMPIHEHCTCGVLPLFGTEPVASVGTTVRVEEDPELGPRLMAASWSDIGPRVSL